MPIQVTKLLKRVVAVTAIALIVVATTCLLAFTTYRTDGRIAVIAKYFAKESLKAGDLILVEVERAGVTTQSVYRLEKIQPPDEASRLKVRTGGHRGAIGRSIAQAIADMDFKPTYSVSVYHSETNSAPLTVNERKIKGKVIRFLGSPIKRGAP